jgi:hypothetical protein
MDICNWCDQDYSTHCVECEACFDEHSIDCSEAEILCDWCDAVADRRAFKTDWCGAMNVCVECDEILQDKLIEVITSIKLPA